MDLKSNVFNFNPMGCLDDFEDSRKDWQLENTGLVYCDFKPKVMCYL